MNRTRVAALLRELAAAIEADGDAPASERRKAPEPKPTPEEIADARRRLERRGVSLDRR